VHEKDCHGDCGKAECKSTDEGKIRNEVTRGEKPRWGAPKRMQRGDGPRYNQQRIPQWVVRTFSQKGECAGKEARGNVQGGIGKGHKKPRNKTQWPEKTETNDRDRKGKSTRQAGKIPKRKRQRNV